MFSSDALVCQGRRANTHCGSLMFAHFNQSDSRRGAISMLRLGLCILPALAVALCSSGAGAAGVGVPSAQGNSRTLVQQVHSVYEAEESLLRRGYYDVRLERASLPYSFNG